MTQVGEVLQSDRQVSNLASSFSSTILSYYKILSAQNFKANNETNIFLTVSLNNQKNSPSKFWTKSSFDIKILSLARSTTRPNI